MVLVRGVRGPHAAASMEPHSCLNAASMEPQSCLNAASMLPQSSTLKNYMPFVANRTTIARQASLVGPVYMASISQTASSNRQAMTVFISRTGLQLLQKALHAPPRNRKLTTPPMWAIRLKPLLVCARNSTLSGGCTWTIQTARTCTVEACSQSLYNTVHN